jgi:hypothetical protein
MPRPNTHVPNRLPAPLLGILETLRAFNPEGDHWKAITNELVQVLEVEDTPAIYDPVTNTLTCPHCGFAGIHHGQPQLGPAAASEGFHYLEDVGDSRDCDEIDDNAQMTISSGSGPSAEDPGRFARLECRNCYKDSAIPDNLEYDFV